MGQRLAQPQSVSSLTPSMRDTSTFLPADQEAEDQAVDPADPQSVDSLSTGVPVAAILTPVSSETEETEWP